MNKSAKKTKAILFFAALTLLLTFVGCDAQADDDPPNEHIYTQVSVTYSEENSQYSFKKNMFYTETDFADYYFELTTDDLMRLSCIETTDRIIANLGSLEKNPEIYIFSDDTFNGVNIVGNALYTYRNDWQSVDYVTDVILAAYGEGCHYGTAYGYAAILCERFGWKSSELSARSTPEITEIYDLNLLCFDRDFVSQDDIFIASQTACRFANYLIETYGEQTIRLLLSESGTDTGMAKLCEKLCEYYATQSIDYSPSYLRFGYGGVSYAYMLKSEFGTFYIGTTWTDANAASNPLVTENFLHEDYISTKEFFEQNLDQMHSYQELFDLVDYDNDLTVIFPNSRTGSQYSYYQSGLHRIIVYNVDSFMHEYIHALTKPSSSQEQWQTEGFARYFSYYYDRYGVAFLNEDYNTAVKSEQTEYLFEFKQTIDRPIDMQIDFKELENIAVYSRNYTDPNASYVAGSSFIQYLVREYGETFVAQCIYGDATFPMPYSESVAEWNRFIEETYSDFSRYND